MTFSPSQRNRFSLCSLYAQLYPHHVTRSEQWHWLGTAKGAVTHWLLPAPEVVLLQEDTGGHPVQALDRSSLEAVKLPPCCEHCPSRVCSPGVLGLPHGTHRAPQQSRALSITQVTAAKIKQSTSEQPGQLLTALQLQPGAAEQGVEDAGTWSGPGELLRAAAAMGTLLSAESRALLRMTEELGITRWLLYRWVQKWSPETRVWDGDVLSFGRLR